MKNRICASNFFSASRYVWALVATIVLFASVGTPAAARDWTCNATMFAIGTSQQFTPRPWKMNTGGNHVAGFPGDREKSCKNYIEKVHLGPALWQRFQLSTSEQNRICANGGGNIRIEYGFDRRPKSWQFTEFVPAPPCDCELRCKAGYSLGNASQRPRCTRKLCEVSGIPDDRFGPHEDGIGIWNGGIYHHQPVERGMCKFRN